MRKEASSWRDVETGGLLFGKIKETPASIYIEIHKTILPDDLNCKRETFFFEIDPIFSKDQIKVEKKSGLTYLGNWHCHLGYGGPSSGDRQQIPFFFKENSHRDKILTFILNRLVKDDESTDNYEFIVELYKRLEAEDNLNDFHTYRIPTENISFTDLQEEQGVPQERINFIKSSLVDIFNNRFSINDIEIFNGQTPNEKIISFPYTFQIASKTMVTVSILLSFPPEYPEGDIYIDISSIDRSKNFTFDTRSAEVLDDDDLFTVVLQSLKEDILNKVPNLLEQPLWKIMVE